MRVAALDCGTNTIRLLIADLIDGTLHDVHREMRIVRLGQGVDRTGVLAPEAIERTRVALADYAAVIAANDVDRVRLVATSATRDARNRADFVQMVQSALGSAPEVVTGLAEAALAYDGAVGTLPGVDRPVLLVDLGGGSTELVLGGAPVRAHSMDVGSVRMTERHLHDDPPTQQQVDAAVADVRAAIEIARHDVPLGTGAALVGVAGTITTIAAISLELPRYDRDAIHGSRHSAARIAEITARLVRMDHDARAAVTVIHPGRVDVMTGGAIVLSTVVEECGAPEIVVSEHDILDGIALSLR